MSLDNASTTAPTAPVETTLPDNHSTLLPTLHKLGSTAPESLSADAAETIASDWLQSFSLACISVKCNPKALLDTFLPDHPSHPPFWRDILALTWHFRTFKGGLAITQFAIDQQEVISGLADFTVRRGSATLERPFPDLAWIQALFTFSTPIAKCSGVLRLVPLADKSWKAHTLFTNMDDLKAFPEKVGHLRNPFSNHGLWASQREEELRFKNVTPTVIVVGSGHSGLSVAARLKYLGVNTLLIEKNNRVGDNWRNRYDALCLHDSVWYDHMPYLPFPSTWPVYTPARKIADWLESYAHSLELNVWTSSTVLSATQKAYGGSKGWEIQVQRPDGTIRTFEDVPHLILATGFGGGGANFPKYPGMDIYKGNLLHSTQHKNSQDHLGKKVFIVGSGTSAHDIASDFSRNSIDVTIFQRSSTYVMSTKAKLMLESRLYCEEGPSTDVADLLTASMPLALTFGGLAQRTTAVMAQVDKETLEGLTKRGFRLNTGIDDTGMVRLAYERFGGYYLDAGASQLIIDGKIKLKNDGQITEFTERGIKFDNGSEVEADVVIFATGLGNSLDAVRNLCGEETASKCTPIWGLNDEGEIQGTWRDFGVPGLFYMSGGFGQCRFHSKHVALQIKAIEEGVFGKRYVTRMEHTQPAARL